MTRSRSVTVPIMVMLVGHDLRRTLRHQRFIRTDLRWTRWSRISGRYLRVARIRRDGREMTGCLSPSPSSTPSSSNITTATTGVTTTVTSSSSGITREPRQIRIRCPMLRRGRNRRIEILRLTLQMVLISIRRTLTRLRMLEIPRVAMRLVLWIFLRHLRD